ncbi:MAG: AAA family ATPase [Candidatus Coatesbacteria bacterium]|nr:AAA family ATPase [Candidatus Coatesbacteria bacterium]
MSPKKKAKQEKPKPIDLKLTLENFGPLRKAEIDLKPMTIFIGPNNSGKSYAAMMFYSLFRSYWHVDPGPPIWPPMASQDGLSKALNPKAFLDDRFCYDTVANIMDRNPDPAKKGPFDITPEEATEIGTSIFQRVSLGPLTSEVGRIYGATMPQLGLDRDNMFSVRIDVPDWSLELESSEDSLAIRHLKGRFGGVKNKTYNVIYWEAINGKPDAESQRDARIATLGHALATESLRPLWRQLERGCHYLPGERPGLMLLKDPFINAILQQNAQMGGWERRVSAGPRGVDSDFFRIISQLGGLAPGPLAHIAVDLESDILRGSIQLKFVHKNVAPHIMFRTDAGLELELHQCSLAVIELAPIVLHIKHIAQPGCIMIIDEPEAHLHPGAIRILAKYLVKLVREGVNLILTTHSDYLFGQINNYILWGKVRKKREEDGSGDLPEVYLEQDEFGAYLFKRDTGIKSGLAYRTEPLHAKRRMTEDGLPEDMFIEADDELYEDLKEARIALAQE